MPIILSSIVFNYIIGENLNKSSDNKKDYQKQAILILGITFNLSLLAYFKYSDFFISNFNIVFNDNIEPLKLILPLAISFFTFQQITYLVDSYRQEIGKQNFLNYVLFVTFFPQLIAGPIVHHKEMMPQFSKIKNKVKSYKNIAIGIFLFSIGLFKKVVIADTFAKWASAGFDTIEKLNLFEAWATSLSYTFQLYFDFSGYADMAIGLALLFNIKLPINFNSPYKATNIQDFWRRWHITLSSFLRDYVYIPLGGNRKGKFREYNNLMIVFLLGGFWHGAGWTFVFWGLLHGLAIIIQKEWESLNIKLWKWLSWLITFNFVNIAWIFFRAEDWSDAVKVLSSMFSLSNVVLPNFLQSELIFLSQYGISFTAWLNNIGDYTVVVWLFFAFIVVLLFDNSIQKTNNFQLNYKTALFSSTGFLLGILSLHKASEFLYFNF